jgi:hypothetical protein
MSSQVILLKFVGKLCISSNVRMYLYHTGRGVKWVGLGGFGWAKREMVAE